MGQTLPLDVRTANDCFTAMSGNPSEKSPASAERRFRPFVFGYKMPDMRHMAVTRRGHRMACV